MAHLETAIDASGEEGRLGIKCESVDLENMIFAQYGEVAEASGLQHIEGLILSQCHVEGLVTSMGMKEFMVRSDVEDGVYHLGSEERIPACSYGEAAENPLSASIDILMHYPGNPDVTKISAVFSH